MPSNSFAVLLVAVCLALGACRSGSAPNRPAALVFNPPNQTFAQGLGIMQGPVSGEQAKQIAAAAAGGTARTGEQEDEDGVQVFGVKVRTAASDKDVKVRISDGSVTKIDSDNGIESPGREAESGK